VSFGTTDAAAEPHEIQIDAGGQLSRDRIVERALAFRIRGGNIQQVAIRVGVRETLVDRNGRVPQSRRVSDMSAAASAGAANAAALAQTAIMVSTRFTAVLP
jgi:hypothetical protein